MLGNRLLPFRPAFPVCLLLFPFLHGVQRKRLIGIRHSLGAFFRKSPKDGGQIANRLIDIHSQQPRILIFQILSNFCGFTVVFDKLTISVPILFGSHTDCQVEGEHFIKLFRVSETGSGANYATAPSFIGLQPAYQLAVQSMFPSLPSSGVGSSIRERMGSLYISTSFGRSSSFRGRRA